MNEQLMGGIITGNEIIRRVMNGQIAITNFDPANVNPNSYNLTLDNHLKLYKEEILDSREENKTIDLEINEDGIMLKPGRIYIGSTVESTFQTDDLVPMLSGRSSYARLGIDIHKTAGFGDVGFHGTWTLEIAVTQPVIIYPNTKICQIYFMPVCGVAGPIYEGKYIGQKGATPSMAFKDEF